MFGKHHSLVSMYTLDSACRSTKVETNPKLQTSFLLWVLEGIIVLHLRRELPLNTSRALLENNYIPCLLLLRRCVSYLVGKFKFNDEGFEEAAMARKPSQLLQKTFGSYASFHQAFPKGFSFEDAMLQDRSSAALVASAGNLCDSDAAQDGLSLPVPVASSTWVSQYCKVQQKVINFLRQLMEMPKFVLDIFVKALNQNQHVSAEEVMAMRDWAADDIFDLEATIKEHTKDQMNDIQSQPGDDPSSASQPPPSEQGGGTDLLEGSSELIELSKFQ